MSVLNPDYTDIYAAAGTTGPYPITFDVVLDISGNAQDILVQVVDSAGVTTDITSTSTITGMNVYTAVAYDATNTIVLVRYPDVTQPYTFPFGTKFPSKTFENALDRLLYLIQRGSGDADLALKAPFVEVATPPGRLPTITERKNTVLGFDDNGDPIASAGSAAAVSAAMAPVVSAATLAAGRTAFDVYSKPEIDALSPAEKINLQISGASFIAKDPVMRNFSDTLYYNQTLSGWKYPKATAEVDPSVVAPVGYVNAACHLVGNKVVHTYPVTGASMKADVYDIADDMTITRTSNTADTGTVSTGSWTAQSLSDSRIVIGYMKGGSAYLVCGDESSGTITFGAVSTAFYAGLCTWLYIARITSTMFFICYTKVAAGCYGRTCTIDGSKNITLGTEMTISASASVTGVACAMMDADEASGNYYVIIVTYIDVTNTDVRACPVFVTDATTYTLGSDQQMWGYGTSPYSVTLASSPCNGKVLACVYRGDDIPGMVSAWTYNLLIHSTLSSSKCSISNWRDICGGPNTSYPTRNGDGSITVFKRNTDGSALCSFYYKPGVGIIVTDEHHFSSAGTNISGACGQDGSRQFVFYQTTVGSGMRYRASISRPRFVGFTLGVGNAGDYVDVQIGGLISGLGTLKPGKRYYIDNTGAFGEVGMEYVGTAITDSILKMRAVD